MKSTFKGIFLKNNGVFSQKYRHLLKSGQYNDGERMMQIRPAQDIDIEKICAFDHVVALEDVRRRIIEHAVADGHLHVADESGEILGYVILVYTFFTLGFVDLLYVHPDHRRKGIGAALMRYAERICTTEKLFTSTNLSNTNMQSLLMNLGFEESGIVHGLDEGDPELFYRKVLK